MKPQGRLSDGTGWKYIQVQKLHCLCKLCNGLVIYIYSVCIYSLPDLVLLKGLRFKSNKILLESTVTLEV